MAQFEDVLANGFASDLREPAESMRVRVLALIAARGVRDVWTGRLADRAADAPTDPREFYAVKASSVRHAIEVGMATIEMLPTP